jgi:hypothetical protein
MASPADSRSSKQGLPLTSQIALLLHEVSENISGLEKRLELQRGRHPERVQLEWN